MDGSICNVTLYHPSNFNLPHINQINVEENTLSDNGTQILTRLPDGKWMKLGLDELLLFWHVFSSTNKCQ
ncbi:hypothetical protein AtNW77_Chr1g0061961 [Arabidopsis thaliana]